MMLAANLVANVQKGTRSRGGVWVGGSDEWLDSLRLWGVPVSLGDTTGLRSYKSSGQAHTKRREASWKALMESKNKTKIGDYK
jgi:hypothetical protein